MADESADTVTALGEMLNGPDNTEANASDDNQTKDATQEKPAQDDAEKDDKAEIDWKQESRKWEERAKANKEKADAHDAVAAQIAELETAKTTAETELASANDALEKANTEILRYKVAALHRIDNQEDIELFLTATDEETLTKQAQRIAQTSVSAPRPDPAQGKRQGSGTPSAADEFAAAVGGML